MMRFTKSRSGSSGYEDQDVAAMNRADRRSSALDRRRRRPSTNLFTSRWSPMSRLFSIDPVGDLEGLHDERADEREDHRDDDRLGKYSRAVDFVKGPVRIRRRILP